MPGRVREPLPQLGQQPAPTPRGDGLGDDQRRARPDLAHVDLAERALRGTSAGGAERRDPVVAHQHALAVGAQRVRPGGEQQVQRRDVVGHQRGLVGADGVQQAVRCWSAHAKSALRMVACTPFTTSTTWLMRKSVAADR